MFYSLSGYWVAQAFRPDHDGPGSPLFFFHSKKVMRRKHDILWKVVMEEVFDDLLRFCFSDAAQVYDLERGFEFMDKELAELYPEPEKGSDTRFADKLVKVYHRDGEEEWVLLHVEIQGDTANRSQFAERMFRYFYRILDRFRRPVSAIAIFTGHDGKKMPDRYEYVYRTTRVTYQYHSVSILDFTDAHLEMEDNPFALVVLAAKTALLAGKIPERQLLERKVALARRLLAKGYAGKKVRAILRFLENSVLFDNPEMNRIFMEQIQSQDKSHIMGIDEYMQMVGREEGIEIGMEKGIEEGMEKGRHQERRTFVENLLSETEFSDEKIAGLANVTVDFVKEVRMKMKSY